MRDDDDAGSVQPPTAAAAAGAAAPRVQWQAFQYCGVAEVGACLATCRAWRDAADFEAMWAAVYENTQRVEPVDASGEALQPLICRPFGEDAVGWRVAVLVADDHCAVGLVVAYDVGSDSYLVRYGEGDESPGDVWESERMHWSEAMTRNPSLAGKSRFTFVSPPAGSFAFQGESSGGSSGSSSRSSPRREQQGQRSPCAGGAGLLKRGSWRDELKHNVRNVPSRLVQRLRDHTDEVLFVAFSPCGRRLASCSRDRTTIVWGLRAAAGEKACHFEKEATLRHATAACRARWWPSGEATLASMLLVMTEDTSYGRMVGESAIELWEILPPNACAQFPVVAGEEDDFEDLHARRVFRRTNYPFDIYTAIVEWPPPAWREDGQKPYLCFFSGHSISFTGWPDGHYMQWLDVWPGPTGFGGEGCAAAGAPALARLQVQCGVNYLHELEAAPDGCGGALLALSGSRERGNLCDELVRLDLNRARGLPPQARPGGTPSSARPLFEVPCECRPLGERVVLSVKWSRSGDRVLLNTRPFAGSSASSGSASASGRQTFGATPGGPGQPPPDLSTSMELLVLDARTLETVGTFNGHFAFTTKECPFKIYMDDWADLDYIASGGEDKKVHVWHQRHGRPLRRLCGHTAPVNAVSWGTRGLLATASDDNTVAIWSPAGWRAGEP